MPLELPTTEYWQLDGPPHTVKKMPDGFPGPEGYHYVLARQGLFALWAADHNVTIPFFSSPSSAPLPGERRDPSLTPGLVAIATPQAVSSPLPTGTGLVPPPRQRRTKPHGVRVKLPRPPREPRPSRPWRLPRPPRDSRYSRFPRKPRKEREPRAPRPPRKPRKPGTKQAQHGWCHVYVGEGMHNRSGEIYGPAPDGGPPFPSEHNWIWFPHVPGVDCVSGTCSGPLADLFKNLLTWFGHPNNPRFDPRDIARYKKIEANLMRRRLRAITLPSRFTDPTLQKNPSTYCCQCGTEPVGCWSTVGDCRLLPVLQKSKGQC